MTFFCSSKTFNRSVAVGGCEEGSYLSSVHCRPPGEEPRLTHQPLLAVETLPPLALQALQRPLQSEHLPCNKTVYSLLLRDTSTFSP